jgi:ArsR family transcriptional regulator
VLSDVQKLRQRQLDRSSQPTCGEHLKLLSQAGLIRGRKIKQRVFYRRDENRIAQAKEMLGSGR